MIKRKGMDQIENLTPNHKPLKNRGQMSFDSGMLYIIWKIILRAIRYCPQISKKIWLEKDMSIQSFETTKVPILGLPFGNLGEKWHLNVVPIESHRVYYGEGSGASFQRLQVM
jgi:hypothetical protein